MRAYSALALTLGRGAGTALGLATVAILARVLSKEQYGAYQQVWLLYFTALPFASAGLPASVAYFVPQLDRRGQKTLIVQTAFLLACGGFVIATCTLFSADFVGTQLASNELDELLRAFFVFPIFALPLLFVDALLVAIQRAPAAATFTVITSLLQFGAVVIPISLGFDLRTAFYCIDAAVIVRLLGVGLYLQRLYRDVPLVLNLGFLGRQLKYALPLGISAVVGHLSLQLGRLFVAWRFSPAQYAVYVNGAMDIPFVSIIPAAVMTVVTPEMVRLHRAGQLREILEMWHSATRKVSVIFFPLTSFLLLFGTDAIVVLFSPRYAESSQIFRICVLILPLRVTVYGALLMASGRSGAVFAGSVLSLAVTALLCYLLIPILGVPGAAIATVAGSYTGAGWMLHQCASVLRVSWTRILPWRALGEFSVLAMVPLAVAGLVASSFSAGVIRLLIGAAAFAAATFMMLYVSAGARSEFRELARVVLLSSRPLAGAAASLGRYMGQKFAVR